METLILFKIFGLYFLVVGLAFIVNPVRVKNVYSLMLASDAFLYLSGVLALLLRAAIISIHNVWVLGLPLLITIIGWMCLLKGVGLLVFSKFAQSFAFMYSKSDNFFRALGFVLLLLGLFMSYHGWIH